MLFKVSRTSLKALIKLALTSEEYFTETPTAKARWVLNYIDFQNNTNAIKTNLFH